MGIALTIAIVLLAVAVGGCVVLWKQRGNLVAERDRLSQQIDSEQQRNNDMQTELAVLRERTESDAERLAEFKNQIDTHLKALAGEALKSSRDEFLKQAGEKFTPLNAMLEDYRQMLRDIEGKRAGAYSKVTEQVEALKAEQRRLQQETANLVKALRRPEGRGRWGEMQMQRLFELAGMTDRVDFNTQATQDSGDRPDFIIRLPNDRTIVIDVKTPLDAYLDATEATDEADRERHLDHHARQVRDRVKALAAKNYQDQLPGSPEFVVMFIPGEAMLYAAAHRDADLMEWAMEKNVVIATPTLTLALLKTVAMGWREKSLAENAAKIAAVAAELYKRLRPMFDHLNRLHSSIKATNSHFNKLVGSLENSVLPQARRMESLDPKLAGDLPDELKRIELTPRTVDAPEATAPLLSAPTDDEADPG